ncbi:MAG: hypothetical protein J6I37_07110 [Prevotella sp.]|jgi:hypothetical protein|nr:hypothetical protein [Prevotella sp.]
MTPLSKFDPDSEGIRRSIRHILDNAPVLNLTLREVISTLRLVRLQAYLADRQYQDIYVHNNDVRLQDCDDTDRFLALLLECGQREQLLGTKRCRLRFGGSPYHWRKIARDCEIVTVASAVSDSGSGYYGRGWILAPNIVTLRKWIVTTTENPDIKRLKV